MSRRRRGRIVPTLVCAASAPLGGCVPFPLFDTSGPIGTREATIIVIAFGLMMIVVVPVFVMTFLFAWRYRASKPRGSYAPHWGRSFKIDLLMWAIPAVIVAALGGLEWHATHVLNPYHPLDSNAKPLKVDVVALNWKWLFIYPAQHVASLNQLVFPVHVPVSFRLTSNGFMTSFFIPGLGSQIYAMPGMRTELHLIADRSGTYIGRNYQYDGRGYSRMQFQVRVIPYRQFRAWLGTIRRSSRKFDKTDFRRLEEPGIDVPVAHYAPIPPGLFMQFLDLYRAHPAPPTFARNAG